MFFCLGTTPPKTATTTQSAQASLPTSSTVTTRPQTASIITQTDSRPKIPMSQQPSQTGANATAAKENNTAKESKEDTKFSSPIFELQLPAQSHTSNSYFHRLTHKTT